MSLSSLKSISFQLQKHITQPVKSRNNRKALKILFRFCTVLYILPKDYGRPIKPISIDIQNFQVWQIPLSFFSFCFAWCTIDNRRKGKKMQRMSGDKRCMQLTYFIFQIDVISTFLKSFILVSFQLLYPDLVELKRMPL